MSANWILSASAPRKPGTKIVNPPQINGGAVMFLVLAHAFEAETTDAGPRAA